MKYAGEAGIPRDTAWSQLTEAQRHWVIEGSPNWKGKWNQQWYGIKRFFGYLESKAYKMHIRVLLSKYRSYTPCPACGGARLKLEALLWRLGSKADADRCSRPTGVHAGRRGLVARAAGGLAGPDAARPDAAADRPAARASSTASKRRRTSRRPRLRSTLLHDEDPHPTEIPVRRRHRLPHARPAEPHALRRRGAAHQPHDRARHLARQHPVRARRALDRPASARHEPHRRGHASPARRRQHAGRGRARSGGDARRRPPDRHGPGPGRARRRDRLRRHALGRSRAPTR